MSAAYLNYLFSLSPNPPQHEDVSNTAFEEAVADEERVLGLVGQGDTRLAQNIASDAGMAVQSQIVLHGLGDLRLGRFDSFARIGLLAFPERIAVHHPFTAVHFAIGGNGDVNLAALRLGENEIVP